MLAYVSSYSRVYHVLVPADIEKEVLALKREEQKLIKEIKQTAAKGNSAGAKQLAKSLIRLRGQEAKLQASMGQLRGVKTSIAVATTAKSCMTITPCSFKCYTTGYTVQRRNVYSSHGQHEVCASKSWC